MIRDKPDRRRKVHLPWREDYFRHRVATIRAAAGIDRAAKFTGLRHGGNTEDADLTDARLCALSGHRTADIAVVFYGPSSNGQSFCNVTRSPAASAPFFPDTA